MKHCINDILFPDELETLNTSLELEALDVNLQRLGRAMDKIPDDREGCFEEWHSIYEEMLTHEAMAEKIPAVEFKMGMIELDRVFHECVLEGEPDRHYEQKAIKIMHEIFSVLSWPTGNPLCDTPSLCAAEMEAEREASMFSSTEMYDVDMPKPNPDNIIWSKPPAINE